jgi:hypothetical protein
MAVASGCSWQRSMQSVALAEFVTAISIHMPPL